MSHLAWTMPGIQTQRGNTVFFLLFVFLCTMTSSMNFEWLILFNCPKTPWSKGHSTRNGIAFTYKGPSRLTKLSKTANLQDFLWLLSKRPHCMLVSCAHVCMKLKGRNSWRLPWQRLRANYFHRNARSFNIK